MPQRKDPSSAGERIPKAGTSPNGEPSPDGGAVPNGEPSPNGGASPNGEASPNGGAVPNGEPSPDGGASPNEEAFPNGGASPNGEAAPNGENPPELRGLYRHVKISVRALDIIIVAGILAISVLVLWSANTNHGGYLVRFDAKGGSDVASQRIMYGEPVTEPENPDRTGYTFGGWYADEGYSLPWDFAAYRVEGDLTLYARWDPVP